MNIFRHFYIEIKELIFSCKLKTSAFKYTASRRAIWKKKLQGGDLSTGSEFHLVDGASGKEGRQRKWSNTPHENLKPGNRNKKEREIWKYGTTQGGRFIDGFSLSSCRWRLRQRGKTAKKVKYAAWNRKTWKHKKGRQNMEREWE